MSKTKHPIDKLVDSLGKNHEEIVSALGKQKIELKEYEHSNRFYTVDPNTNKSLQIAFGNVEDSLKSYFTQADNNLNNSGGNLIDVLKQRGEQLEKTGIPSVAEVKQDTIYEVKGSSEISKDSVENVFFNEGEGEILNSENYNSNGERKPRDLIEQAFYDINLDVEEEDGRVAEEMPKELSLWGRIKNYFSRGKNEEFVEIVSESMPSIISEKEKQEFGVLEDLVREKVNYAVEKGNQKLADAQNDYNILDEQYAILKESTERLESQYTQLLKNHDSLKDDHESIGNLYDSLKNDNGVKGDKIDQLIADLDKANILVTELRNEVKEYEDLVNDDETLKKVQEERKQGPFYKLAKGAVALALIAGVGFAGYTLGTKDIEQAEPKIESITRTITKEVPVEKIVEKEVIKTIVDTTEVDRLSGQVNGLNTHIIDLTADSRYLTIKTLLDKNDKTGLVNLTESYIQQTGNDLQVQGTTCDEVLGNLYNMMVSDKGLADTNSRNEFRKQTLGTFCFEPKSGRSYKYVDLKVK